MRVLRSELTWYNPGQPPCLCVWVMCAWVTGGRLCARVLRLGMLLSPYVYVYRACVCVCALWAHRLPHSLASEPPVSYHADGQIGHDPGQFSFGPSQCGTSGSSRGRHGVGTTRRPATPWGHRRKARHPGPVSAPAEEPFPRRSTQLSPLAAAEPRLAPAPPSPP